jgi:hypothetical protein
MVGQYWAIERLEQLRPVAQKEGWQTSVMRDQLGLLKQKHNKGNAITATHAVVGVALAAYQLLSFRQWQSKKARGGNWVGECRITPAPFAIIRRPPICRRQLHLMIPYSGGLRRKYGGTTTRHGFRKGDYVQAEMAGRIVRGWVSGDTERQVSVSDVNWKRLGQFTARKVQLLQRSTGLLVNRQPGLSILPLLKGSN